MEDDELNAIRQARMSELRGAGGRAGGAGGPSGGPSSTFLDSIGASGPAGGRGGQSGKGGDEELAQQEEMKRQMLSRLLDGEARERLSRIALVKPAKARSIEDILLRMAQSGQVRQRVTEQQLIGLLDQVDQAQGESAAGKITYTRKKTVIDEDDDDFDL